MVKVGTPTRIATQNRGAALTNVLSIISSIQDRVYFWARGSTLVHFNRERLMLSNPEVKGYFDEVSEKIRKALNSSFESLERITADPKGIT